MTDRQAGRLGWGLLGVSLVVLTASITLRFIGDDPRLETEWWWLAISFLYAGGFLAFPAVGALIISRYPGNAIGWLFSVNGLLWIVGDLIDTYAGIGLLAHPGELPGAKYAAWISSWIMIPSVMLPFTALPLLYPTGRLLSSRWRPLAWACVISVVVLSLAFMVNPGPLDEFPAVNNPFGLTAFAEVIEIVGGIAAIGLLGSIAISVVSFVLRFRRAWGVERQQLKWFAYVMVVLALFLIEGVIVATLFDRGLDFSRVVFSLGWLAIPTATGIAILRYRLFDIDVVINRTIVYSILSIGLALTYVGGVLILNQVFQSIVRGPDLAVIFTTLAITLTARPARDHVQRSVDRRFYRHRYDAIRTVEDFRARLRHETDLAALADELRAVVQHTMHPTHVSVWLRFAQVPLSIGEQPASMNESIPLTDRATENVA